MNHPQWLPHDDHSASLSGELTRDHIPALWQQFQGWQPPNSSFQVCLKSVKRVDSAGMVMLIHLIEHAKRQNCHIMLTFMPEQLKTLFELSNIDDLFSQNIDSRLI
ncbi:MULTISPECIES: STAS domain-containing protein [Vibrio]|uniref:STAS domain-containing protein n=1 Tax=Vibrio algicola TaxID=2662262 RepID=A0A5Q0TAZ9_9VIBR|nr:MULTISPECIES: lipid asymmetry maintenance protein MlaB [Vibrio]MBD1576196.1 STAS domain-containing protein [Vibrio sp. S11_S32]